MTLRPLVLAAGILALLPLPATTMAQDAGRGAALLAEARKALGGEDRLAAVKTLQVRGDFKRAAGQNTIEGELELTIERPDKLRRDEDLSPPGGGPAIIRTEVVNGAEAWEENTGGGRAGFFGRGGRGGRDGRAGGDQPQAGRGRGLDPEQARQLQVRARQADLARWLLSLLLVTNDPVAWVGTAQAPDGRADVLEITPAQGPALRLFLDEQTHVPLMLTWSANAGRGQQATLQVTLGEYKAVNGIRFPHLITRGVNDQTNEEWTIRGYRVNPGLRGDTFTRK